MESDSEEEWELCVMDEEPDCSKWVEAVNENIGGEEEEGEKKTEESGKTDEEKEVEKVIVEQPIYMLPLPSPVCHVDFNFN